MATSIPVQPPRYAAPPSAARAVSRPIASPFFSALIVYYWLLQYTSSDYAFIVEERYAYWMFIGPTSAFAVLGVFYALSRFRELRPETWALIGLMAIVGAASVARLDPPTLLTVGLMCLVLIAIFQNRPTVSPDLINILFLVSIPLAQLLYLMGLNPYSAIPALSDIQGLSWRIAMLPHVAASGFFALVVLFMNLTIKGTRFRLPCLALGAYFLLFSGIRTAVISALFAGGYLFLRRVGVIKGVAAQRAFFALAALVFILSVFSTAFLFQLPILNDSFLHSFLIRDDAPYGYNDPTGQVFTAAIRTWIINQHLDLFLSHPLFGYGTFDLYGMQSGYGVFDQRLGIGSEAFLTGMFARIGLPALLFVYAVFFARRPVPEDQRDFVKCIKLFLFLAMITYGSFVTPYDFVFNLMIVAISTGYAVPGRQFVGASTGAGPVAKRI